jgi:hypothetical protein
MSISPFFATPLSSAYQAELDDLTFDSEGKDVLRHRLAEKRKELHFLRLMIETAPEMVAVVFNQAFVFKLPAIMENLTSREADELPDWDNLADAIALKPWAQPLAQEMLKEPMGDWLLTVAAGLEYLYAKPGKPVAVARDDDDNDGDEDLDDDDRDQADGGDGQNDDEDETDAHRRRREEAGEDWMEAQGFDRKNR